MWFCKKWYLYNMLFVLCLMCPTCCDIRAVASRFLFHVAACIQALEAKKKEEFKYNVRGERDDCRNAETGVDRNC